MKNFFEQEINSCQLCNACREARTEYQDKDKRWDDSYSNILPGFSSSHADIPIDVLIVAEAHGGGRKETFRAQLGLEREIEEISSYYLVDPIQTFHQHEMRKLFQQLDEKKITWLFTDLIKCYAWNRKEGKRNVEIAISYCKKYLDKEIDFLRPKKIICLGRQNAKNYFGMTFKPTHGAEYNGNVIWSYFPSGNTADLWVKNNEWNPVVQRL